MALHKKVETKKKGGWERGGEKSDQSIIISNAPCINTTLYCILCMSLYLFWLYIQCHGSESVAGPGAGQFQNIFFFWGVRIRSRTRNNPFGSGPGLIPSLSGNKSYFPSNLHKNGTFITCMYVRTQHRQIHAHTTHVYTYSTHTIAHTDANTCTHTYIYQHPHKHPPSHTHALSPAHPHTRTCIIVCDTDVMLFDI